MLQQVAQSVELQICVMIVPCSSPGQAAYFSHPAGHLTFVVRYPYPQDEEFCVILRQKWEREVCCGFKVPLITSLSTIDFNS